VIPFTSLCMRWQFAAGPARSDTTQCDRRRQGDPNRPASIIHRLHFADRQFEQSIVRQQKPAVEIRKSGYLYNYLHSSSYMADLDWSLYLIFRGLANKAFSFGLEWRLQAKQRQTYQLSWIFHRALLN